MFYVGTYHLDGDTFTAEVDIAEHTHWPGMKSVFGVSNAHLSVTGTISGNSIHGQATTPQAPGVRMDVEMNFLAV
ncbi:hypothetical protein LA6_003447 [Marinibacterium anthonyi]|nr:hypothetical protein LA6_003447 [Marinibacterium anthonyi]